MHAIRLAVPPSLAVLWRNSVGVANHITRDGVVMRVPYGLCVGSSDLVGIRVRDGRFVALEVKGDGGRATPEQRAWLALVERCGGVGGVVWSVGDALELLR